MARAHDPPARFRGDQPTMRGMRAMRKLPNQDSGFEAQSDSHLRQRTAALNAILNSAASAIITTDLQGHITSFNPAAEAMFRMAESQATGRPITDFSDPDDA